MKWLLSLEFRTEVCSEFLTYKLKVKPLKIQKLIESDGHTPSELDDFVFTDEVFPVQQAINKHNDWVWLSSRFSINLDHLRSYRKEKPASVMV